MIRDTSATVVTLLVVEDDETLRGLNDRLLRRLGFKTVLAVNGEDALRKLGEHPDIDCILMDCLMPVMDGYEATRKVREDARYSNLPIVALTGSSSEDDRNLMLQAGMNDHLNKPIDPADLDVVLSRWVNSVELARPDITSAPKGFPIIEGLDTEAGMAFVLGDPDLYARVLRRFLTGQENFPERFDAALCDGDFELAEREVHTLKTILKTIGAKQLWGSAVELEKMCSHHKGTEVPEQSVIAFTANLELLLSNIRNRRHELSGYHLAEIDGSNAELLDQLKSMINDYDTSAVKLAEGLLVSDDSNEVLRELVALLQAYDFESAKRLLTFSELSM